MRYKHSSWLNPAWLTDIGRWQWSPRPRNPREQVRLFAFSRERSGNERRSYTSAERDTCDSEHIPARSEDHTEPAKAKRARPARNRDCDSFPRSRRRVAGGL